MRILTINVLRVDRCGSHRGNSAVLNVFCVTQHSRPFRVSSCPSSASLSTFFDQLPLKCRRHRLFERQSIYKTIRSFKKVRGLSLAIQWPIPTTQPPPAQLTALILTAIVTLVAIWLKLVRNRIERKGPSLPPGPTPLPLLGSVLSVDTQELWSAYTT